MILVGVFSEFCDSMRSKNLVAAQYMYFLQIICFLVKIKEYIRICSELDSIFGMQICFFFEELFHLYILSKCNNKKGTGFLESIHTSLLSTCILIECNCAIYFTIRQRHKVSASLGFRMWKLLSLQYINFFLHKHKRQNWHNNLQILNNA